MLGFLPLLWPEAATPAVVVVPPLCLTATLSSPLTTSASLSYPLATSATMSAPLATSASGPTSPLTTTATLETC